jgi:OOP family OmpA-OmpF porin
VWLVAGLGGVASAQTLPAYDADRFAPAVTDGGYMMVEAPAPSLPAPFTLAFRGSFLSRPLFDGQSGVDTVTARSTIALMGSVAPGRRVELALMVPLIADQAGQSGIEGGGIGDLRFVPKLTLIESALGLALLVPVSLPTGDDARFEGAGEVTVTPLLAVQAAGPRVRVALDGGVLLRSTHRMEGAVVGSELVLGAAIGVRVVSALELMGELLSATELDDAFDSRATPLEALGGVRWDRGPWSILAGAGAGLLDGRSEPRLHALLQLGYAPRAGVALPPLPVELASAPPPPPSAPPPSGSEPSSPPAPEAPPSAYAAPPAEPEPAAAPIDAAPSPEVPAPSSPVVVTRHEIKVLKPIFFDLNRKRIRHRFRAMLALIARTLQDRPAIRRLRIEGYADAKGGHAFNQRLSLARSQAVVAWLVAHGVAADRLEAVAFGAGRSFAADDTEEARASNRRVMFHIVEWAAATGIPNAAEEAAGSHGEESSDGAGHSPGPDEVEQKRP